MWLFGEETARLENARFVVPQVENPIGRETVRAAIFRGQGFSPDRKRELALLWLREKEASTEARERAVYSYLRWTFVTAVVAASAAIAGIVLMLTGY
jgi:hypothetical protein